MARTRFQNLDEEKQLQILDAAGEEFADKGYDGASVNQIIKKAGISKGALYYYFEDKSDLFATVVTYVGDKIMNATTGVNFEHLTAETYWPMMEEMGRQGIRYARDSPWYIRFARTIFDVYDAGQDAGPKEKITKWANHINIALIERGQELGLVRTDVPVEYLSMLVLGAGEALDRWLLSQWDEFTEEDFEDHLQRSLDMMRRLLNP